MQIRHEELSGVLSKHLKFVEPGQSIPADVELSQLGLDSMGAIDMLLDLEQTFDITIPDEFLTAESFSTVQTIENFMVQLLKDRHE